MAQVSKDFSKYFLDKIHEEEKRAKIVQALVDAGIIDSINQKEIRSPEKMRAALALYVEELKRQDAKGSTASQGKYIEVANRVKYAIARKGTMRVYDFACRNCQQSDMIVTVAGKQSRVEIKTHCGVLANGLDARDTWETMAVFAKSSDVFLWYFNLADFDYTAPNAFEELDYQPYFLGTKAEFIATLASYNGDPDTWLKMNANGTAINIQSYTNSRKKREFVYALETQGMDWTSARDENEWIEK